MPVSHLERLRGLPPWAEFTLWTLVILVLVLPLAVPVIERNIELFLLAFGALAVTVSSRWSGELAREAARAPIPITVTVLAVGLAFHYGRPLLDRAFRSVQRTLPLPALLFLLVTGLGLASSVITAIIAALILTETMHLLRLGRKQEIAVTVLASYAIGLGAVLTPIGEPLATIVTAKLGGNFLFLARLMGPWIIPGVLLAGLAASLTHSHPGGAPLKDTKRKENLATVLLRTGKVFIFVEALVLLGTGLSPLSEYYVPRLHAVTLFWCNTLSAVLDNATLASAEVTPALSPRQLTGALLSLLVSGGLLIPGNIPNIIAASHLRIRSGEWAKAAFLPGMAGLLLYFLAWFFLTGPA